MFKNRPPFATFLVNIAYAEINFDQYLQLKSLWFCCKEKKMLSIDINHIYGGYVVIGKKQAQVWANLEANSWRLMGSVIYWGVVFQIHHMIEKLWWWEMITSGLKSPNELYFEAKNQKHEQI